MKKYLLVALSMALALGFAAPSFAIHAAIPAETTPIVAAKDVQIQLEGEIRIRGWYEDNITNADGAKALVGRPYEGGSMSWYDQRVRLAIDTRIGDNVSGRIHLENTSAYSADNYLWGETSTVGAAGAGGSKRTTDLRFLEAWIAYTGKGLLGVPAGIRVGHMPTVIGEGVFFDHRRYGNDAILFFVEPAKGTEINLLTAKLFESTATDNTNDVDLNSLMLTHKLDKDNTLGLNWSIINSRDMDGADGGVGPPATTPTIGTALYRMPGAGASGAVSNYRDATLNLHNVGLSARGKVSDIGYKATVDFQFGKVKDMIGAIDDVKFSGYGVTLGANYKLDPVTLRANFVYGSGDDNTDGKNKAFQTFVGNVIDPNLPTVVYGWRVDTAAGSGIRGTGIANTTAYNLGATYSPLKDLTLDFDYYLLRASEKLTATGFGSDKEIGSELNLKASYRLARNLTYSINSGILFAGDFYETGVAGVTNDAKNAVVFQHQIVLRF